MSRQVTPTYVAYLVGTPDVALDIVGGTLSEDAGRAPRWQGTLRLRGVSNATFAALDPKLNKRIRVEVSQLEWGIATTRTFDLGLRARDREGATGIVTVTLASDEALVIDYARLVRGTNTMGTVSSLRTLVEWTLAQVFSIANLNANTSARVTTTGFTAQALTGTAVLSRVTGITGASDVTAFQSIVTVGTPGYYGFRGDLRAATPNTRYTVRAEVRANTGATVYLGIDWYTAGGVYISSVVPDTETPGALAWAILTASGIAPATATQMRLIIRQSSAGAVGNYIQGTNIQLAAGAYAPIVVTGPDADITPYWEATNLFTNPTVANTAAGYSAGTNTSSATWDNTDGFIGGTSIRWVSAAAGDSWLAARTFPVTAGQVYVMQTNVKATAGRNLRMVARFRDPDGNLIKDSVSSTTAATGSWTAQLYNVVTVPKGSATMAISVVQTATAGAQPALADGFLLVEVPENDTLWLNSLSYFDGSNPGTGYTSAWDDGAHASSSTRFPIFTREPDSLFWEPGQKGWDFIDPLVQSVGLRLVCNELRQWSLRPADYLLPGTLPSMTYGQNLVDSSDSISRDDEEWYDSAVVQWRWSRRGIEKSINETYASVTPWTKTVTIERDTPYPGPGLAQYAVQRAQGRGRQASATTVAQWSAATEMLIDVQLEQDAFAVHCKVQQVTFDLDRNEMTATMRTI